MIIEDVKPKRIDVLKLKCKDVARKGKQKISDTLDWCVNNPEKAAIAVPAAIGIVKGGHKALKRHQKKSDQYERDCRHWDPHNGVYYDLKKPLTSKEKAALARRHDNGEKIYDILDSFGKLKK